MRIKACGPVNRKMTQREKCKGPQGGNVYDRMCDPSGYTGAHAERFGQAPAGSQSARTAPSADKPKEAKPRAAENVESARDKCKAPAGGNVYDRMCDPSGYTGAHAARFGQAPAPAAPAAAKPVAKAAPKYEAKQEPAREKCKGPQNGSVYDRLTDPSGYTGAHAERFDAAGRGKGLAGRDSIAKGGSSDGLAHMVSRQ